MTLRYETLLLMLALSGCSLKAPQKAVEPGDRNGAKGGAFDNAKLCGTHLAFTGHAAGESKDGLGRPIGVSLALAVCGDSPNEDENWKALAAGASTTSVAVNDGSPEPLYVDAAGNVSVDGASGPQKIGTLAAVEEAQPIELAPGVAAELLVNGERFKLGRHGKEDSGMTIAIKTP